MKIDFRVYPHFYEDICKTPEDFEKKQEVLNIHKNSIATISHIKNQMRLAGLDYLVLHAQDENSIDKEVIVSNEDIYKLVKEHSEMFLGIASVDPNDEEAIEKLKIAFEEYNLLGLRLNLSRLNLNPNDDKLLKLMDFCNDNNKPVIFETGISYDRGYEAKYANPKLYENLIIKYPKMKICFTRCAWPYTRELIMLMMKYKNVYTDTGLLYFDSAKEFYTYLFEEEFRKTWIDRSLNHQIIFASENPRFEQIRMANSIEELDLHPDTIENIKYRNAFDFLGVEYE